MPSTRPDQSVGIRSGIAERVPDLARVSTIVHGTTVGTNALLERKGARTGLITTAGFRDVLEMRRRDRPQTWGLWGSFVPVVPRDLRREVAERVLADGTVLQAVDPAEVQAVARALLADGVEAVCVFFVNGYANAANEAVAAAAVRGGLAERVRHRGHRDPARDPRVRARLHRGGSTPICSPRWDPTWRGWGEGLGAGGFAGRLLIVPIQRRRDDGGDLRAATPVKTALSGPAAGVIAAAEIARAAGFQNVITCDMGGTSFGRLADRRGTQRAEPADQHRFRPGDPQPDDRDHDDRRRRRLDRRHRPRRPAGRSARKAPAPIPGRWPMAAATTGRR